MNPEETDEFFCRGLVKLLRDGVPLERIDGRQIRMAAEQYRAEYMKRLEQENVRLLGRLEAKKKEMEFLGLCGVAGWAGAKNDGEWGGWRKDLQSTLQCHSVRADK